MKRLFSLDNLLQRAGGWYIIIIIAIAQLTAVPGAVLGTYSILINTDYNIKFEPGTFGFILIGNLILLEIGRAHV